MKNNNKKIFSAKKSWLGIFVLALGFFSFGGVAKVEARSCSVLDEQSCYEEGNGQRCYWSEEASSCKKKDDIVCEARTRVGCALDDSCFWDSNSSKELKCTDKGYNDENKYDWNDPSCDNGEYFKDNDAVTKYWYWEDVNGDKKKKESGLSVSIKNICKGIDGVDMISHVCDYPQFLSNSGKRKCRKYNEWRARISSGECFDKAEIQWEASLKDVEARNSRSDQMESCRNMGYMPYTGPVFTGPGLRGGSQLAQRELSDSISKQRDIKKLLIDWSRFAIEIALVLAVIAIIWAGIRYITDLGDGSGVEAAKKIILWTIVGIFVILGSYAIVNTVIKARFSYNITTNKFIV